MQLGSGDQGRSLRNVWLFCILNSSKHCPQGSATTNGGKSLHQKLTLLKLWGSEFWTPNQYTGFRIALNMTLIELSCQINKMSINHLILCMVLQVFVLFECFAFSNFSSLCYFEMPLFITL